AQGFVLEGLDPCGRVNDLSGAGLSAADVTAHVVDPYRNATQWGQANPLTTALPLADLGPALAGGRWAVLEPASDPVPVHPESALAANAAAIMSAAEHGAYRRFVVRHQRLGPVELEHLTLQAWLLSRSRALHGRWLADLPPAVLDPAQAFRFQGQVAAGWRRVSELSYLALRRVRSGRPAPNAVLAALTSVADAEASFARDLPNGAGVVSAGARERRDNT
ncbi:MAG TPA: hypothetical protein VF163_08845, partial [Micromonosporaceae bacterium]